jgi:integrase
MAVRPRNTKDGVSYDVATFFQKKQYWEFAGTNKRDAQRLDAQRKLEVKNGTFVPPKLRDQKPASPTIASYMASWGAARTNSSAPDDRRNLARFLAVPGFAEMAIDQLRPRHTREALDWLKLNGGVKLKTLQNAYGSYRTMCRDAQIAELLTVDPCVLPRGYFEGEESEPREPYGRAEAAVLLSHHLIPWPVRVLNALCMLAGLREGEACGRRWRDFDQAPVPLAALDIKTQYEGRKLKTRRARVAPVHPELREILEAWAAVGFVQLMGRPPMPDDFVVPRRSNYTKNAHWSRSTYYKAFVASAAAAGIRTRTLHAMRHTMITLARRGGADKHVLEKVTHNAKGDVIDRYTHRDWAELCTQVLAIGSLFASPQTPPLLGTSGGISPHALLASGTAKHAESHSVDVTPRLQFPAPPLTKQHKTSPLRNPVQSPDQSPPGSHAISGVSDEEAFDVVLAEHPGAQPPARPPAKTVPYVARKRVHRG